MASHRSSPSRSLALGNGAITLSKGVRRHSQVAQPQSFASDAASAFYSEEAPLDPQLQGPSATDSYAYYEYPRSNLTFGAGFGANHHDAHIEICGDDGTPFTVPASDAANLGLDAMSRFEKGPDPVPWIGPNNVEGMRGWKTATQTIPRPQDAYSGYRNGPTSDMGTSYSHVRNDSGYISKSYHESEQLSQQGEETRSMIQQVEQNRMIAEGVSLDFASSMHLGMGVADEAVEADATTSTNSRSWNVQSSAGQHRCQHPECSETKIMNPSEYKKHMQRHEKPFRCSVSGCKRSIDGFATPNDRARHIKSVHHELPASANERSFICKGHRCTHRSKIWPRLDNFKAHCKRRHRSEDLDDLVRRSAFDARTQEFFADAQQGYSRTAESGSNSYPEQLSRIGRTGAVQVVHQDTTLGLIPTQPGNDKVAVAGARHPDASLSDAQISILQRSETQMHDSSMGTEPDPLAGLPAANIVQQNLQKWPVIMEELERNLISDFAAAQGRAKQLTPNELGAIAKQRFMDFLKTPRKRMASEAGLDTSDERECKQEPSTEQGESSQLRIVKCSVCSKEMSRLCDLKKHEKRHSRPWGCTDEKCNKTFGSKNDWKRHENSQHYQLETWRCHEPCTKSRIGVCAKTFFRQDPFRMHLRKEHGISGESYMREQCRQRRIGRNWQDRFWCGFCKAIVKLQQKGLHAWDERFNHIDDCHFKKGQSIDLWYPLDKDMPKGQLRRERNARTREDAAGNESSHLHEDDEAFTDPSDEETDLSTDQGVSTRPPPPPPPPPPPQDLSTWSSPSRSFSEEHTTSTTTPTRQSNKGSKTSRSTASRKRSRTPSCEDSTKTDSRQASLESDSEEKGHSSHVCRSCFAPINLEIDTSCPECGVRLALKSIETAAT